MTCWEVPVLCSFPNPQPLAPRLASKGQWVMTCPYRRQIEETGTHTRSAQRSFSLSGFSTVLLLQSCLLA